MMRFLRWQIAARLFPDAEFIVPFTKKTVLIAKKGRSGATGNVYCGIDEFVDMSFVLHFLRPGDLFIDVGANIGSYTVLASGHCGVQSIAVEPVPSTFQNLQKNVRVNDLSTLVNCKNACIGNSASEIWFSTNNDTTNHVVLEPQTDASAIRVPMISLDDLVANASATCIKIDVEGFEGSVIDSGSAVLSSPSLYAVLLELNGAGDRYGFSDESTNAKMIEHGFSPYGYEPFSRTLTPITVGESGSRKSLNVLYIRGVDFVRNRLLNADRVELAWTSF